MTTYSIKEISNSKDRFKIYILSCRNDKISEMISFIQSQSIEVINIGKELATLIDSIDDYSYLNIEVYENTRKVLEKYKSKMNCTGNDMVAIFNLGILLEPSLEINAVQLLKEFSKSASLIIIWENETEIPERLNWSTQKNKVFFDFSDT